MPLDELHARRLATVVTMVENALDRIELVLRGIEKNSEGAPGLTAEQCGQVRAKMEDIRHRLKEGVERFSIRRSEPEPRQVLAAELSTLWIILENAMPKRMKGYGREFAPADKADWEVLIEGLSRDVEQIRRTVLAKEPRPELTKHPSAKRE